jgi:sarcosine oxidase/L-pipecolate oxidase
VKPNSENVIKFALHAEGHTYIPPSETPAIINPSAISVDKVGSKVSAPRTIRTHGPTGTKVPLEALKYLHERLQAAYPELGQLPLDTTRLCWYTDTPDEDWMIDEVPQHSGLFLATGGSGHAFKVSICHGYYECLPCRALSDMTIWFASFYLSLDALSSRG